MAADADVDHELADIRHGPCAIATYTGRSPELPGACEMSALGMLVMSALFVAAADFRSAIKLLQGCGCRKYAEMVLKWGDGGTCT